MNEKAVLEIADHLAECAAIVSSWRGAIEKQGLRERIALALILDDDGLLPPELPVRSEAVVGLPAEWLEAVRLVRELRA